MTNSVKIIFLTFFLLLIPALMYGNSPPKIILINSDASIEKYKIAQRGFKKAISYPVLEIDLADPKWQQKDLKKILTEENPDIVYCIGSKAYFIAIKYVSDKTIVFSSIINWLRLPLAGKTYGVSNELHSGMQLMIYRYIFPKIKKIGILYSEKFTLQWFKQTQAQAIEVGIEILGRQIDHTQQKEALLKELLKEVDAFWLISDPIVMPSKYDLFQILQICDASKKPVFSYNNAFARLGSVLVVSADTETIGKQVAVIAEEVIENSTGKFDTVQNVQFPAGSRIILNLKKVREYGLQYSEEALDSINHIIE